MAADGPFGFGGGRNERRRLAGGSDCLRCVRQHHLAKRRFGDGRYTYAGYQTDTTTGLYYANARYYNPATGTWTSQDPLGFDAGDSNLYRYVNNGPTNGTDPSGQQYFLLRGIRTDEDARKVELWIAQLQSKIGNINCKGEPPQRQALINEQGDLKRELKAYYQSQGIKLDGPAKPQSQPVGKVWPAASPEFIGVALAQLQAGKGSSGQKLSDGTYISVIHDVDGQTAAVIYEKSEMSYPVYQTTKLSKEQVKQQLESLAKQKAEKANAGGNLLGEFKDLVGTRWPEILVVNSDGTGSLSRFEKIGTKTIKVPMWVSQKPNNYSEIAAVQFYNIEIQKKEQPWLLTTGRFLPFWGAALTIDDGVTAWKKGNYAEGIALMAFGTAQMYLDFSMVSGAAAKVAQAGKAAPSTVRLASGTGSRVGPAFNPQQLDAILNNLERLPGQGVTVIRGEQAARMLGQNANAAYMTVQGERGILILRDGATRLEVIEELIHHGQAVQAGFQMPTNVSTAVFVAQREIAAQERLLQIAQRMNWTQEEVAAITQARQYWQQQLQQALR